MESNLAISNILIIANLIGDKWYFSIILFCKSLIVCGIKYFSLCLKPFCIFLSVNCSKYFVPFSIVLLANYFLIDLWTLYILKKLWYDLKIFSQFLVCLFILHTVAFAMQVLKNVYVDKFFSVSWVAFEICIRLRSFILWDDKKKFSHFSSVVTMVSVLHLQLLLNIWNFFLCRCCMNKT